MRELRSIFVHTENEIVIEKSRFICNLFPVNTASEAQTYLDEMRLTHNKASHNCYAYILGAGSEIQKCSDDGEPSGTAGLPMLNILKYEKLSNILAVVTRYFGGIKLGTGGLSRAYGSSVKEALIHSNIMIKHERLFLNITISYAENEQVKYILLQHLAIIERIEYLDLVTIYFYLDLDKLPALQSILEQRLAQKINFDMTHNLFV